MPFRISHLGDRQFAHLGGRQSNLTIENPITEEDLRVLKSEFESFKNHEYLILKILPTLNRYSAESKAHIHSAFELIIKNVKTCYIFAHEADPELLSPLFENMSLDAIRLLDISNSEEDVCKILTLMSERRKLSLQTLVLAGMKKKSDEFFYNQFFDNKDSRMSPVNNPNLNLSKCFNLKSLDVSRIDFSSNELSHLILHLREREKSEIGDRSRGLQSLYLTLPQVPEVEDVAEKIISGKEIRMLGLGNYVPSFTSMKLISGNKNIEKVSGVGVINESSFQPKKLGEKRELKNDAAARLLHGTLLKKLPDLQELDLPHSLNLPDQWLRRLVSEMERDEIYTLRVLKLKSGSEDDMKLKFPEYKNIKHDDYKDKECGELINFLQKSRYLEILDLSGLVLTQKEFYELFKIIDQKPRLKDITIPIVEGLTPKELIAELSKMIGQNPKLSGIKISIFDGSKQKELKPEKLTVVSKKHAAGSDPLSEEASPESAVQKPLASQAATAAASPAAEDGDDNSPPPSRSH